MNGVNHRTAIYGRTPPARAVAAARARAFDAPVLTSAFLLSLIVLALVLLGAAGPLTT